MFLLLLLVGLFNVILLSNFASAFTHAPLCGKNTVEFDKTHRKRNIVSIPNTLRYKTALKDLLGLGAPEIAICLVAGLVLFGPETLKSLSKDFGKAAAELKEIPKTFKEGMDEGSEAVQISKMKAIAAAKRKKRDDKLAQAEIDEGSENKE